MSLDDKLRAIPIKWSCKRTHLSDAEIEWIKQAFLDEGYVTPENAKKIQELVDQMASLAHDMAKLPVIVERIGSMTGAEFYSRYYTEIHKVVMPGGNSEAIEVYHDCDKAARKAAGL